ncbi:hypothetical protein IMSAGC006_02299 [Muribaculaceae bacterium]|nr:hypothetical protein IMSAGC006_02299 [Muribaculaceae bacterium]
MFSGVDAFAIEIFDDILVLCGNLLYCVCVSGEFGVVAETVDTVVIEELGYGLTVEIGLAGETCVPVVGDGAEWNGSHAGHSHTVLVGHVGKTAGHPAVW